MKRLTVLLLVFFLALLAPLAYLTRTTYQSLEKEETARLRYFAETVFDLMEEELGRLVVREEGRAVDEFSHYYEVRGGQSNQEARLPSPLASPPDERFILGYLQNNPDGSFQTPLVEDVANTPPDLAELVADLAEINQQFNGRRTQAPAPFEVQPPEQTAAQKQEDEGLADKYVAETKSRKAKESLGAAKRRVEEITAGQAQNVVKFEQSKKIPEVAMLDQAPRLDSDVSPSSVYKPSPPVQTEAEEVGQLQEPALQSQEAQSGEHQAFQVEVDPLQSVIVDESHIFIFRRIAVNNQIFRQGFVIRVDEFLKHLTADHFAGQPMSRFTHLSLAVVDQGRQVAAYEAGTGVARENFSLVHIFPRPFSFLRARLACEDIPRSASRSTLNVLMAVIAAVLSLGLLAIYQSARVVVDLSEKRTRFVSSVTHELKTPLTNIRMYIEMLEQGIARDLEREQDYFRIIGSESARLSRLINNVLEFSKLEKKQRPVELKLGTMEEVVAEVEEVMSEKLRQEGFTLTVDRTQVEPFYYDREVMVQVLINLIENSMKFGRDSAQRKIKLSVSGQGHWVKVGVSDTGPGIPHRELKKIFEDFYRGEDSLIKATKGTGLGLALVKKLAAAMNGRVTAENNPGAGCTISISLPTGRHRDQKR